MLLKGKTLKASVSDCFYFFCPLGKWKKTTKEHFPDSTVTRFLYIVLPVFFMQFALKTYILKGIFEGDLIFVIILSIFVPFM